MTLRALIISTYVDKCFTYQLPDHIAKGAIVEVNFHNRKKLALVTDFPIDDSLPKSAIKPITKSFSYSPLSQDFIKFIQFVSFYYMAPIGACLKFVLPHDDIITEAPTQKLCCIQKSKTFPKVTKTQKKILDFLAQYGSMTPKDLAMQTLSSIATIKKMQEKGMIAFIERKQEENKYFNPDHDCGWKLEKKQGDIYREIKQKFHEKKYQTCVLEGVTGSGKTIVYLELVAEALRQKKSALILLPEIALTNNMIEIFEKRFTEKPIIWHSQITKAQKKQYYRQILGGDPIIVIGARSALFMPICNLGIIIVDEEHDQNYKQETSIRYHGRDMAIARAYHENIMVVLVSATLSLETRVNIKDGKYFSYQLTKRANNAELPEVHFINLCKDPPKKKDHYLSPILEKAIQHTWEQKEQTLLFVNRRGYAPIILCTECGYKFACEHCDSFLVDHREKNKIICHFCHRAHDYPKSCTQCNQPAMRSIGMGVERIGEEIAEKFPNITFEIITSETTQNIAKFAHIMKAMQDRHIDLLIGTQILTKGHHFPYLTLVGILDGDTVPSITDPRTLEKQYQLLYQCAGRAGRSARKGFVYLQAYEPNHILLSSLKNHESHHFWEEEIKNRARFNMPPFSRLVAIIVQAKSEDACKVTCQELLQHVPHFKDTQLLGPVPASIRYINDIYRYRFLFIAPPSAKIQPVLKEWRNRVSFNPKVQINFDVDPYSFF